METTIAALNEFIDTAKHNRKYASNTAFGKKAALKLIESELNEDERNSLETLMQNLDRIFSEIFRKRGKDLSVDTIETYRRRLNNLIKDYQTYGVDTTSMVSWNAKPSVSTGISKKNKVSMKSVKPVVTENQSETITSGMICTELPIRADVKATIIIPADLSVEEVKKLQKYFEFLECLVQGHSKMEA